MNTTARTLLMLGALLGLFALLALEKWRNDRAVRSFRAIIHVNGIRGKTSTCRMLDAVLRQRFAVFTKTTGSDPRVITVSGADLPLRRLGQASIAEQIRVLRRAHRERAEVVIIECMATRPDLQAISQEQIVQANIGVITNVRYDHVLDMGGSLQEIAAALAGTIPRAGTVYTADADFYPFFEAEAQRRGSAAVLCPPDAPGHENESIARAVAAALGVEEQAVARGLLRVPRDIGMTPLYQTQNVRGEPIAFLNLFAANDPQSAWQRLRPYLQDYATVRYVYNNRWDRPDRALLFARHFFAQIPQGEVLLLGDDRPLARRMLRRHAPGLRVAPVRRWEGCMDVPEGCLLVGLGNIRGEARRMLEALEKEAKSDA